MIQNIQSVLCKNLIDTNNIQKISKHSNVIINFKLQFLHIHRPGKVLSDVDLTGILSPLRLLLLANILYHKIYLINHPHCLACSRIARNRETTLMKSSLELQKPKKGDFRYLIYIIQEPNFSLNLSKVIWQLNKNKVCLPASRGKFQESQWRHRVH